MCELARAVRSPSPGLTPHSALWQVVTNEIDSNGVAKFLAEEWTKAALITTVLVGLLTVNWIALKGKRAVAEAQRKQAMKSLGINPKDVAEKSVKKKKKK